MLFTYSDGKTRKDNLGMWILYKHLVSVPHHDDLLKCECTIIMTALVCVAQWLECFPTGLIPSQGWVVGQVLSFGAGEINVFLSH